MNFADYIGIPFEEKGYTKKGANCWGLVVLFKKEQMNEDLPLYQEFYTSTTDKVLEDLIKQESEASQWKKLNEGEELPGDVVLLRMHGLPIHVGIVAPQGKMLHVEQGKTSVLESYKNYVWNKRIVGFYRFNT